ncbi:MAG: bifunctional 5,10-methylene-tetrahydrofolate dehydrogenase/5,10-methylene-tetrahydrofolate cyclohydrolase [Thaumarchaeota archaeon]|nr:bifunctional 5,10-methylene-tetrahydrofolate dehydrogenase/5,10-methylene-tetrahydrofolate cyclohydrolase [Nitrososphaerota archaeon]
MTAVLMDGRALAAKTKETLKEETEYMKKVGVDPKIATILVGDDAPSKVYLASKHRTAEEIGIRSENHTLSGFADEAELSDLIDSLNADPSVNGILLQLPLPQHLDSRRMIDRISAAKDVDGLTSGNMGLLFYGRASLIPCTPRGVMELLHHYTIPIMGSRVVIINRSTLVGKPLLHLLLAEDATVTVCHSKSRDLLGITRQADILVSAVGRRPQFVVTREMVRDEVVVVDVAMNRVGGKLLGDVDFEGVSPKASFITPVPGGVGPMTVIMLMENTLVAAAKQHNLKEASVLQ